MSDLFSDEQLARQLQQGNEQALETLVRRYHNQIHAYCVRMGLEYHNAADVVQEVFIKVCRNICQYKPGLLFRPWIYAIASNTCKDFFKKAYVKKDVPGLELCDEVAAALETPEGALMVNLERENVQAALNQLREIHREVLVLRYYQELKLEEIAWMLQIPEGTVKSRLSTALHNLKRVFAEELGGDIYARR